MIDIDFNIDVVYIVYKYSIVYTKHHMFIMLYTRVFIYYLCEIPTENDSPVSSELLPISPVPVLPSERIDPSGADLIGQCLWTPPFTPNLPPQI